MLLGCRIPSMLRTLMLAALLPITVSAGGTGGTQPTEPPLVAAAADLQFALGEVAEAFKRDTGQEVKLAFGSSGNLTRQIRQNAPFQLFFSADETFVTLLAKDGFARDEGALYASGRIVLIVPKGSPLKADGSLADLKAALADGRLKKFAIANPEHAPYGRRAEEAMRHVGLWDAIKDKLVLGENVSQAAQFATSANAQGGIIAYSLALSEQVKALGSFELIPAEWHQPLRQRMALLRNAGPIAVRFYDYVQQPAGRMLLRKYGFVLPNEAS
jgi:molybdate transport system substrate-binding protein